MADGSPSLTLTWSQEVPGAARCLLICFVLAWVMQGTAHPGRRSGKVSDSEWFWSNAKVEAP